MFVLIKSQTSLKMCHVGSKTRSQGQTLGKPYVCSRGYIFNPIIMKLCQNIFLDKVSDEFENGSKTRSLGQMLGNPYVCSRGHIFSLIIIKLSQIICLNKITDEVENGSCWVKNKVTRSNVRKTLCML